VRTTTSDLNGRTFVIVPGGTNGYGLINPGPTRVPRVPPIADQKRIPRHHGIHIAGAIEPSVLGLIVDG